MTGESLKERKEYINRENCRDKERKTKIKKGRRGNNNEGNITYNVSTEWIINEQISYTMHRK